MSYTIQECRGIERKINKVMKKQEQADFLDELFYYTNKNDIKDKEKYEKFIDKFLDDYNFFRKRAISHSRTMFLSLHNAFLRYGTNLPPWKRLRI